MREIDSRELTEWMVYAKMEPFGAIREDYRAGIVATVMASVFGGKKSNVTPETFFPELGYARGPARQESPATMKDKLIAITKSLGGKMLKKGENKPEKPVRRRRKR